MINRYPDIRLSGSKPYTAPTQHPAALSRGLGAGARARARWCRIYKFSNPLTNRVETCNVPQYCRMQPALSSVGGTSPSPTWHRAPPFRPACRSPKAPAGTGGTRRVTAVAAAVAVGVAPKHRRSDVCRLRRRLRQQQQRKRLLSRRRGSGAACAPTWPTEISRSRISPMLCPSRLRKRRLRRRLRRSHCCQRSRTGAACSPVLLARVSRSRISMLSSNPGPRWGQDKMPHC